MVTRLRFLVNYPNLPRGVSRLLLTLVGVGTIAEYGCGPGHAPDEALVANPRDSSSIVPSSQLVHLKNNLARCERRPPNEPVHRDEHTRCLTVAYTFSRAMPLSLLGVGEIREAARRLSAELFFVSANELHQQSFGRLSDSLPPLIGDLLAAGVLIHHPSVVVFSHGSRAGPALVGYKTAGAYANLIRRRLSTLATESRDSTSGTPHVHEYQPSPATDLETVHWTDIRLKGTPGAYFRHIPGHQTVAYSIGTRVHLLDLPSKDIRPGPGYVDLVPSPDGRILVSPSANGEGLAFYDANVVLRESLVAGAPDEDVSSGGSILIDSAMPDHYPSIGVIRHFGSSIRYRVLTSWSDRASFRDYDVQHDGDRVHRVEPIGPATPICDRPVSMAILAPNGREVAARDEQAATTVIFRLEDDGSCHPIIDLGVATGKVAWSPSGSHIAFTVPRGIVRDGQGIRWIAGSSEQTAGVFVLDRENLSISRVAGSTDVKHLTFPEFADDQTIIILLSSENGPNASRLRVICCIVPVAKEQNDGNSTR